MANGYLGSFGKGRWLWGSLAILGCSLGLGSVGDPRTLLSGSPASVWAQTPSLRYQEILDLLQLGYNEEQIIEHIDKAGMRGKFALTLAQALELRRKGVSLALIKAMGLASNAPSPPASRPITLLEFRAWLQAKKPDTWIDAELQKRGVVPTDFSSFILFELTEEGVSPSLIRRLTALSKPAPAPRIAPPVKPPPLLPTEPTPPKPPTPPRTPVPPPDPATPTPPTLLPKPSDPPTEPTSPPSQPLPRIPALPTPTQPTPTDTPTPPTASDDPILAEREKEIAERLLHPLPLKADRLLVHPGGTYRLPLPAGWQAFEEIHPDIEVLQTHLSTIHAEKFKDLPQGLSISVEALENDNRFLVRRSLLQITKAALQRGLLQDKTFRMLGEVRPLRWKGTDATEATLLGREKGWSEDRQIFFRFLRKDSLIFLHRIYAKPSLFAEWKPKAEALLEKFEILKPFQIHRLPRLATPITSQKLIEEKTPSVVSISLPSEKDGKTIFRPAGTGFVITKDGYVLTNHHVAVDSDTGKPHKEFILNWDKATGFPTVKADHIASYMQNADRESLEHRDEQAGRISSRFQKQHIDIALLKIRGSGPFPFTKLSPIQDASLGDPIVAMGFPLEGVGISGMGNEDITATLGTISRLVRLADRRVNEVQHTAKISGGNSGGPLFSTQTGGAIGINTWVGVLDSRFFSSNQPMAIARSAMGLGYYYALPIDLAWEYFADVLDVPEGPLSSRSWYDLGSLWIAQGRYESAKRALQKAIDLEPKMALAYSKLGYLYMKKASKLNNDTKQSLLKKAQSWVQRGLEQDAEHPGLLQLQVHISVLAEEWQTASYLLQKLVARYPTSWDVFLLRCALHRHQKKFDEALKDADRVIHLARTHVPFGYIQRGVVLYELQRYYEGQEALRRALKIDPSNFEARLLEASGYLLRKQFDETLRRLDVLDKEYPFEPNTTHIRMFVHIAAKKQQQAWDSFLEYFRRCHFRHTTPEPNPLFFAGILASDTLKSTPVAWGLWGILFTQHSRTSQAARAGVLLAAQAATQQMIGLRYALLKYLRGQAERAEDIALLQTLLAKTEPTGIPPQHLLLLATKLTPRWSPLFLFQLFLLGPSILDRATAEQLLKIGFPVPLLIHMIKVSNQRAKEQASSPPAPSTPAQPEETPQPTPPSPSTPPDQTRKVGKVLETFVRSLFRLLQQGDLEGWQAHCHPRLDRKQCAFIFQQLSPLLRQGTFRVEYPRPPEFRPYHHPQIGTAFQVYFVFVMPAAGRRQKTPMTVALYQNRLFLVY